MVQICHIFGFIGQINQSNRFKIANLTISAVFQLKIGKI